MGTTSGPIYVSGMIHDVYDLSCGLGGVYHCHLWHNNTDFGGIFGVSCTRSWLRLWHGKNRAEAGNVRVEGLRQNNLQEIANYPSRGKIVHPLGTLKTISPTMPPLFCHRIAHRLHGLHHQIVLAIAHSRWTQCCQRKLLSIFSVGDTKKQQA